MRTICILLVIVFVAACAPTPASVADLPTIAVLPTLAPSNTLPPSATFTPSLTNTRRPSLTPTPECWKEIWWNEARPVVEAFFDEAQRISTLSRDAAGEALPALILLQDQYQAINYPDCVDYARFDLRMGMYWAVNAYERYAFRSDGIYVNDFALASESFFAASQNLRSLNLIADHRMDNTSFYIWGGATPNPRAATQVARTRAAEAEEQEATLYRPPSTAARTPRPSATPIPTLTPTSVEGLT